MTDHERCLVERLAVEVANVETTVFELREFLAEAGYLMSVNASVLLLSRSAARLQARAEDAAKEGGAE